MCVALFKTQADWSAKSQSTLLGDPKKQNNFWLSLGRVLVFSFARSKNALRIRNLPGHLPPAWWMSGCCTAQIMEGKKEQLAVITSQNE